MPIRDTSVPYTWIEIAARSLALRTRWMSAGGANLLTVLSFDANQSSLDNGAPLSIVADGDTVYSNGTSLYVASNQAWIGVVPDMARFAPAQPYTEIYQFDITARQPRYVGGGSVPGQLINQYAMSEWDGRLRVATTSTTPVSA